MSEIRSALINNSVQISSLNDPFLTNEEVLNIVDGFINDATFVTDESNDLFVKLFQETEAWPVVPAESELVSAASELLPSAEELVQSAGGQLPSGFVPGIAEQLQKQVDKFFVPENCFQ